MGARKRLAKSTVHENLTRGLVNDHSGRWAKLSGFNREIEAYVSRASAHKQRNLLNRERRKDRAVRQWDRAYQEASAMLRASGDESAPLPRFVAQILEKQRKQQRKWR